MAHADQGKQLRTTKAKAITRKRQLKRKTDFRASRAAPTIEQRLNVPTITQKPTEEIVQPEIIERPTELGGGTFFGNEFNLSDNQLNRFNKLMDQGLSKNIALSQARQSAVRTPGEGLTDAFGNVLDFLSPLFPQEQPAREEIRGFLGDVVRAAAGTEEQFARQQAEQRANQLGLFGASREVFLRNEIDRRIAQQTKITLEAALNEPGALNQIFTIRPSDGDPAKEAKEQKETEKAAGRAEVTQAPLTVQTQALLDDQREADSLYLTFISLEPTEDGRPRYIPDEISGGVWEALLERLEAGARAAGNDSFDILEFFGITLEELKAAGADSTEIFALLLRDMGYIPSNPEFEQGTWILPDLEPSADLGGGGGGFGFLGVGGGGSGGGGGGNVSIGRGIGAGAGAGIFNWRITA